MTYQDTIKKSMEMLAQDERTVFIGYGTLYGNIGYNTLTDIPEEKIIETPLAENLMMGLAIGMSFEGYIPVVFFERHDFLMLGADAMLNHLSTLERMSHNEFQAPVIIRATVGAKNQLYPGPQHIADYSEQLKEMVSFPVFDPSTALEIKEIYNSLRNINHPAMVIERRELYNKEWGL